MTNEQFSVFDKFRIEFKEYCNHLNAQYTQLLKPLQIEAAKKNTPDYPLETCIVYNKALDEFRIESDISLIVIGDNPGKDEQLSKNNKYLVGQSGKVAASFFAKNPELNTDFRKNVIILNKTPVHTAKTQHLKYLSKMGGSEVQKLIDETQKYMAERTAKLHQDLCNAAGSSGTAPELWLVGYAELKAKGLFTKYRDILKASYSSELWNKVFVFQHFSMNRFLVDLKAYMQNHKELTLDTAIHQLGTLHKTEIFC